MADLPFHLVEVPGVEALQAWNHYQNLWRKEGCSAVLLGDAGEAAMVTENRSFNEASAQDTLKLADNLTAEEFFERRVASEEDYYKSVEDGEWPKAVAHMELDAHLEVRSRKPKEKVFIVQIPTEKPHEIPAWLGWGGWNECPTAVEQVAVLRHWHERFGIEIYAMTGDVLECAVARPPTDRETSIALAREQFIYCSDIVFQGVETIFTLAATLQNSPAWYFWWD